ncbi:hypothetical protein [Micrococcus sp. FDAARGOS_333]|uniref:hypothetical protein n=1 Tax=Micrococcus sp. FDAARGOS_333 TaxID=1930558 RepID=UPI000B4E35D5|nr:hypothetical protein [Micrococcus sp. FDAARGOS_333]
MTTTRRTTDAGASTAPAPGRVLRIRTADEANRAARRAGTAAARRRKAEARARLSAVVDYVNGTGPAPAEDEAPAALTAPASSHGHADDWTALLTGPEDPARRDRLWDAAWHAVAGGRDLDRLRDEDRAEYQRALIAANTLRNRWRRTLDRTRPQAQAHRAGLAVLAALRNADEARRPARLPEAPEAAAYPGDDGPPPAWSPPAEHQALTTCVLTAAPPAPASPETGARRAVLMAA